MERTIRGNPAALAILIAIVLVGLGLRVGYAIEQPATPPPDAEAYAQIAESLYLEGPFDARPAGVEEEVQPSSAYSPGLPLLVAGIYWISGGVHLTLALVLLAVLGAAAVPLTYLLGARFGGMPAGLVAAGVLAVYPALLDYQGLLLTEPLAATLLCAGLVVFLRAAAGQRRSGIPWEWIGSGALFGSLPWSGPSTSRLPSVSPSSGWPVKCWGSFSVHMTE